MSILPPEIQNEKLTSSIVKAHVSNLPNQHNEDRFTLFKKDSEQFCFAVFDGHGGDYASKLCSRSLAQSVYVYMDEKVDLLKGVYPEVVIDNDIYDSLLCDAINNVLIEMNRVIKKESAAGTTFTGIFIRNVADGSSHVICANIGDSRTILNYKNVTVPLSEDHNISLEREKQRISEHTTPSWNFLPTDVTLSSKMRKRFGNSSDKTSSIPRSIERLKRAKDLIDYLKLDSADLLQEQDDLEMLLLLMETSTSDMDIDSSLHSNASSKLSIKNLECIKPEKYNDDNPIKSPNSIASCSPTVETDRSSNDNNSTGKHKSTKHPYYTAKTTENVLAAKLDIDADSEFVTMKPLNIMKSTLERRRNEHGQAVGPVALFSRQGVSIMMTRSIGDRNAARTCVCIPDFYKVIIPKGEFARFIIGSDGMWDVMTNKTTTQYSMKQTDISAATHSLCVKAKELREEANIRIDDITCLIVDLNSPKTDRQQSYDSNNSRVKHSLSSNDKASRKSMHDNHDDIQNAGCGCIIA